MLKMCIFTAISAMLFLTVFSGCGSPAGKSDPPVYDSYRDIPYVTDDEIKA